ncbi:hypothetical protein H3N89_gp49 [Microbacterium phage MonChoix]|uniref:Uncharacterized protein n=1 Tax=Microbacterium phage MonChoix TaxID=2590880 RepID=A0A4Y6EMF7_9CAUD|nr:hypothetical protein H3N89_gp49 [Microbacterium phage MonChoix]QDF16014.1 hypothetical protein SEA_MONCHOIX_49 [Microbacterium phage MonChoix]
MELNRHNLPIPTFGPLVPWGEPEMEPFTTPAWVEIEGRRFTWDPETGCYPGLYIEPGLNDMAQSLTADSYYEIEEDTDL